MSVGAGMSSDSDRTPPANAAAAVLPAVVCGASFRSLPSRWHQSGAPSTPIIAGEVPGNTDSWAATPRSVWNLVKPLPRDGIYIWVDLIRPMHGPTGRPLRPRAPLLEARVIAQRVLAYPVSDPGRFRHQYDGSRRRFRAPSPSPRGSPGSRAPHARPTTLGPVPTPRVVLGRSGVIPERWPTQRTAARSSVRSAT
jgi:hypothetical protein